MEKIYGVIDEGLAYCKPDESIAKILPYGFNAVFPFVWYGKGVQWKSDLCQYDPRRTDWDTGLFKNFISKAHSAGLQVHPILTIAKRDPNFLNEYAQRAVESLGFDFAISEFRDFCIRLVCDLLVKHPTIDGLCLDYIRWLWYDAGKDITAERIGLVTEVVSRIASAARALKPGIFISACCGPTDSTIPAHGQDGPGWADKGLIDLCWSMQYQNPPDYMATKKIIAGMKNKDRLAILIANYEVAAPPYTSRDKQTIRNLMLSAQLFNQNILIYSQGHLS